jgi:hypothetical protein
MTLTPKSMQNAIWTRPEFKTTKKNWSFKPHKRNKLVKIAIVKQVGASYIVNGEQVESFAHVKSKAAEMGFNQVRMGVVKVNL